MNYLAIDFGNVISHLNFDQYLRKLSSSLNISLDSASHFLNRTQKIHDLGLTNLNDELVDHFGIKSEVIREEILESWNKILVLDNTVLECLYKLETKYKLNIAILSNIGPEHASIIRNNRILNRYTHHFSCEVGVRKPNYLYYQSFLQLHPEFKGCVYIDDLQENLDVGNKLGFNSYHFDLSKIKDFKKINGCNEKLNFDALKGNGFILSEFMKIEKFYKK